MEAPIQSAAEEIRRLRGYLNNLIQITASVLSTGEPSRIASTLLDALMEMLPLSFAFVRLNDLAGGPPLDMTRVADALEDSASAREIREVLETSMGDAPLKCRPGARLSIGELEFFLASTHLGPQGELGFVVVGSQKLDFPEQTDVLLLTVGSNQLALALQQARLLLAQRTGELATPESESVRSQHDSWGIIDSIPGPIALLKTSGDVEMVNRHLLEYFGVTIREARRWGTNDLVHPEDLPPVMELFTRSIESGTPYESEYRLRRSDGVYRWFEGRARPLRDSNGQINLWCVLLTDIDDRKRAEDAVRASERNLKLIIDTIPAVAWSARTDGSADFFSPYYLDYLGLSLEQVKDWGWTAAVHPDDLSGLTATWQRAMASGKAGEAEARLRRFDGSYRWFLFRTNPLRDEAGKIVKWYGANIDIEDRKQGEEALRVRETSWRQIVDSIPGLVVTTRAMGEVEFLNRQTLEYFGRTSEELKDWALSDAVHPDDLPRVIQARTKSIETGQVYDIEHRCRRADGVYRWFQVRGLPVRNVEGVISDWYLLLTDIDDRKKAEEALQSNEHQLWQVIDAIPALAWCNLPDGSNDFLNKRWHEYTGLSPEQSRGWGWQDSFHPEDLPLLMEKWLKMLVSGEPDEVEARLRRHDGIFRWFLIRAEPFYESGKIVRWYGTSTDIDDRKRAEEELKRAYLLLAEAQRLSKTGAFISDLLADDHHWSEEAYRIFEFDPAAKLTVQMMRDMVHPEDLPWFDSVAARAMLGMDVDFVYRIVTSGGAVKHVRGFAHVMEHVAGRPVFCGAIQDVTESKIAEEALDRARSELAHVTRVATLNTFTASIAHEINQPLAGIITNVDTCLMMLDGDPPNVDGARETVLRAMRDGNRAADVIKRLRALYSKKEFMLESVDLNDAAREVIALSLNAFQRNRVILKAELAGDLPAVICDRVQIQQVILNILHNATDAMVSVKGRPRQLLVRTEREEGDYVRVTVRDAGVGIDRQSMEKLFDAFYTTKADGMGIGLSVSRSIIERHRGRLWAEPNDGPGSTFSFSIPFNAESAGATAPTRIL